MRVLGLDPGTRHAGWGVIDRVGTRIAHVAHGVVSPREKDSLAERLVVIFDQVTEIIAQTKPDAAAVENIFFAKDATAASKLGHARGVLFLACAKAGLPVFEYPPARVKLAVTGHGRSEKAQVAQMMRALLKLIEVPKADAADALAVALTHLQGTNSRAIPTPSNLSIKGHERIGRSRTSYT